MLQPKEYSNDTLIAFSPVQETKNQCFATFFHAHIVRFNTDDVELAQAIIDALENDDSLKANMHVALINAAQKVWENYFPDGEITSR